MEKGEAEVEDGFVLIHLHICVDLYSYLYHFCQVEDGGGGGGGEEDDGPLPQHARPTKSGNKMVVDCPRPILACCC